MKKQEGSARRVLSSKNSIIHIVYTNTPHHTTYQHAHAMYLSQALNIHIVENPNSLKKFTSLNKNLAAIYLLEIFRKFHFKN